jgi:hypothetical protein
MAGWWKADNSTYCNGPRYYMDCNAVCECQTGCGGSWHFCEPGCDGVTCGCGANRCDHWLTGCLQFRYGQCNQDVSCLGRIVCRVVACVPPWQIDPTCTTVVAVDESTAQHNASCWTPVPPESTGAEMPVSPVVSYRTGQIDVFQVFGGALIHKYNVGGRWGTENVGAVSGPAASVRFPNQVPGVTAVMGGTCQVTVEDVNGSVWYFVQGQPSSGNGWGVNQVP